jgi:hypothetical protein
MVKHKKLISEILITTAVVLLIFQQSPSNEIVRVFIGLNVLDITQSAFAAVFSVFVITLLIEFLTGCAVALPLSMNTKGVNKLNNKLNHIMHIKNASKAKKLDMGTDAMLILAVGSAAVVMRRYYHNPKRSFGSDVHVVWLSSLFIALFSAIIAAFASIGILYLEQFGVSEQTADMIVNILTDWKTYISILLIIQGYKFISDRKN